MGPDVFESICIGVSVLVRESPRSCSVVLTRVTLDTSPPLTDIRLLQRTMVRRIVTTWALR